MPIEINNLSASAHLGPQQSDTKLSPAEIEMIAERVIQLLERRKSNAAMARADNSARNLLDRS